MAECSCGGKSVLLWACSGASDVGQIADQTARMLSKENMGKMTCIAALGADYSGFIESARGADLNIATDGCDKCCAKISLEKIGVTPRSYVMTEMGLKKGETSITDQVIQSIKQKIAEREPISTC